MKASLGSSPDSWGVWFGSDPKQPPWERFLDEVAAAGYKWIELGAYGYLPTDAATLRKELDARGLNISAGHIMFDLEDAQVWDDSRITTEHLCKLLRGISGSYLVLIDDVYSDLFTGEQRLPHELDDAGWSRLLATTHAITDLAEQSGLQLVFHPHAETHVEYESQIEYFLAETDSRVGLCFDVGHHAYGGGDPIAFIRRHHDRIHYLHLKSVDRDVQRRVATEDIPFGEAVRMGVFVEPDKGVVDFVALRAVLEEVGYEGFAIVEQDMYPASFDKPFPIAKRTFEFFQGVGLF